LKPWLRQLAAQPRDVVASVVVHHEQSAAGPQQAASLPDLIERAVPERRPERGDDIGGVGGRVEARRSVRVDERDSGPEISELSSADPTGAIDEDHVPPPDRTEVFERTRELALDIQGLGETFGEPGLQIDRKICHEWRV
jgi:hypothetical protein